MRTAALPEDLATRADQVRWTVATNLDTILKRERWSRRAAALALGSLPEQAAKGTSRGSL